MAVLTKEQIAAFGTTLVAVGEVPIKDGLS